MTTRACTVAIALLGLMLGGCLPTRLSGHFGESGYYHHRDHYRVRYLPEQRDTRQLLDASWSLENFGLDDRGLPDHVRAEDDNISEYDRRRYVRGRARRMLRLARYDLEYRNGETGSLVYARTVPLRHPWTDDTLPVLMRRTIASLLTPGADAPDLLGRTLEAAALELRILREGPSTIDGFPAYAIRFSIRTGGEREETITLVGVETPQPLSRRHRMPALIVFGLISEPRHHEADQQAFVSLVSRVDLNDDGSSEGSRPARHRN